MWWNQVKQGVHSVDKIESINIRTPKLVYACNRDLLLSLFCFYLYFFATAPLGFVHVFQLGTFPEPWTLLSSFVLHCRSPVSMCITYSQFSCYNYSIKMVMMGTLLLKWYSLWEIFLKQLELVNRIQKLEFKNIMFFPTNFTTLDDGFSLNFYKFFALHWCTYVG